MVPLLGIEQTFLSRVLNLYDRSTVIIPLFINVRGETSRERERGGCTEIEIDR